MESGRGYARQRRGERFSNRHARCPLYFLYQRRDGKERYEDFLVAGIFSVRGKALSRCARSCQSSHFRDFHGRLWSFVPGVPPSTAFFVGERPQRCTDRQTAQFSCGRAAEFTKGSRAGWRIWKSARSGFLAGAQSHCHCTDSEFSGLAYLF